MEISDALQTQLDRIEAYSRLSAKNVLTFDDVLLLTGLSRGHLYRLTGNRQIPHYKPNGKQIYFDRKEVEEWMKRGRIATQEEAAQQAAAYVVKKGGAA